MSRSKPHSTKPDRVPLGGDYWKADPGAPVVGLRRSPRPPDGPPGLRRHGLLGPSVRPRSSGPEGMEQALSSCEPIHGGLLDVNPEFGHPAGGGWPEFVIWPRFTTLVHQQAYVDWIYRAYQGGLRLVTCLAVNNELLATKSNPALPTDDQEHHRAADRRHEGDGRLDRGAKRGTGPRLAADRLFGRGGPPGHRREPAGHPAGRGSGFPGQLAAS